MKLENLISKTLKKFKNVSMLHTRDMLVSIFFFIITNFTYFKLTICDATKTKTKLLLRKRRLFFKFLSKVIKKN